MDNEILLQQGIRLIGLDLNNSQIKKLLDFVIVLQKWNSVYNLTSLRDTKDIITYHLLDSLATVIPLRRYYQYNRLEDTNNYSETINLLDVGSGAGLPGIVFALCCPEIRVCCVDSVAKKSAFIRQVASTIGLTNLNVIHARIETIDIPSDIICCRAFSSLLKFTSLTRRNLKPNGVWLAMKARMAEEEINALPPQIDTFHVEQLLVPGLDAQRCIVWMRLRK